MTSPADPWKDVTAARIPAAGAAALGPVRHCGDVRVSRHGDRLWVRWPAGRADVVRCLLPVSGVVFLTPRGGAWFPFGSRLPTGDRPPDGNGESVASVLSPARFTAATAEDEMAPPVTLRAVRGGVPRAATALRCRLADLADWADAATTAELSAATAARANGRVVLRGGKLPTIAGATRFWGADVLVPVGFRAEPELRADVLRAAARAAGDELVLLDESGAEVIPRSAFAPVTRAGLRLALRASPADVTG
jgi:hypothetical protein